MFTSLKSNNVDWYVLHNMRKYSGISSTIGFLLALPTHIHARTSNPDMATLGFHVCPGEAILHPLSTDSSSDTSEEDQDKCVYLYSERIASK